MIDNIPVIDVKYHLIADPTNNNKLEELREILWPLIFILNTEKEVEWKFDRI